MTCIEITLCIFVVFLLVWGLAGHAEVDPETLEHFDKLDTLEERIREARSYLCDTDTIEQQDYEMLVMILDPENEYTFNPANDY